MSALRLLTADLAQTVTESSGTAASPVAGSDPAAGFSLGLHLFGELYLLDPLFLGFAPLACLLLWLRRKPQTTARAGSLPNLTLPRSLRQRLRFLPGMLALIGLVCLSIAAARPVRANVAQTDISEGVDILLLVDRSGSMRFDDLERGQSRLEVVKQVVADFAARRMTDIEGASDSVGLLIFAAFPELLCPFTLDVAAMNGFIQQVEIVQREAEDGTAIGVALTKGVSILKKSAAKSKVAVLLTDGENNVEDILPLEAADFAKEVGVRVYTILAGRYQYVQYLGQVRQVESELDTTELEEIAKRTGGRFFRGRSQQDLEQIYAEIEQLERSPLKQRHFVDTLDLYPLWVGLGTLCYGLCWLCRGTWARRLLP